MLHDNGFFLNGLRLNRSGFGAFGDINRFCLRRFSLPSFSSLNLGLFSLRSICSLDTGSFNLGGLHFGGFDLRGFNVRYLCLVIFRQVQRLAEADTLDLAPLHNFLALSSVRATKYDLLPSAMKLKGVLSLTTNENLLT